MDETVRDVDVVVIGGGPAGLAAATCLGRARRTVQVIDRGTPRHAVAAGVHNFLTRDGLPPASLRRIAWQEMEAYPTVQRHDGTARVVEQRIGRWIVASDDASAWSARAILLATGVVDQHPDIPGYEAAWGHSIFHCPYCHGWEVRDRPLAVLGAGPALAQFAPLLLSWSRDVVVCSNGATLEAPLAQELSARGLALRTGRIDALESTDGALQSIRFSDGSRLQREALFVMSSPRLPDVVTSLALTIDEQGWVRIDEDGATSAPGIWAAGDLTSRRHQVMEAAAQGLRAATAINRQLALGALAP